MTMKHAIKKTLLSAALCAILSATSAHAAVPGLINYQGRLTDSNGDPVTGSKTLAVAIYDAATGGNLLYTENIGAVTLDDRGIYSFQFGSAGTSVLTKTETIGTTDGTLTVYNKVLSETALANTVSIADGTYTWTQTGGSSSPSDFLGSFDSGSGTASAIYISGAPAAGRTITATYDHEAGGITGALSGSAEHWLELSIDGTNQASRTKILAVPFAINAETSSGASGNLLKLLNQMNEEITKLTLQNQDVNVPYIAGGVLNLGLPVTTLTVSLPSESSRTRSVSLTDPIYCRKMIITNAPQPATEMEVLIFEYEDGASASAISPLGVNPHPDKKVRKVTYRWYGNSGSGNFNFYRNEPNSVTINLPSGLLTNKRIWFYIEGSNLFDAGDYVTARLQGPDLSAGITVNGSTLSPGNIASVNQLIITLNPAYESSSLPYIDKYTIRFSD